uniref:Nuclear pore protein n=1 Tax=Phallusia mammillata TaxID=59560 RepID=A0A6F9DNA8_9ASCI|nr:nuclear pore complex protein Nup93-like [Phallusia mammillata]
MAQVGFSDLLQRAEELSSGLETNLELPHVQRSFQQLLDAGQKLCSKTTQQQDDMQIKASLLLCTEGKDVPRISDKLKSLASTTNNLDQLQTRYETDIEGFLQAEHESAILGAVEQQKSNCLKDMDQRHWKGIVTSWEKEKENILKSLIGSDGNLQFIRDTPASKGSEMFGNIANKKGLPSSMKPWELAYSEKVMAYIDELLSSKSTLPLGKHCENGAVKMKTTEITSMWKMVNHIIVSQNQNLFSGQRDPKLLLQHAQQYLEQTYREYMLSSVYSLAQSAELGGAPSTLNLVKSFLKISPVSTNQICDGEQINGSSVWAIIFYCLRCGDLNTAGKVAKTFEYICPDFNIWINEYIVGGQKLSLSTRTTMKLHFKRTVRTSSDIYKIAVYCIIGKFSFMDEHKEIVKKTEDYLWFKLCQVNIEITSESSDDLSLKQLQNLVSVVYGEGHFHANDNPLLYFQVLFLTCQFEAAIEFLSRFDSLLPHAVHIALVLHENNQLYTSGAQATLLTEINDANSLSSICILNIAQLVMLYTQRFELSNPSIAMNYFYFLRDVQHEGQSLFEKCLCELIQETGEYEMLLGRLNSDGSRKYGLVDKYCSDPKELITKVATVTEKKGLYEDAVLLYDLSGNSDKVLQLLNRLLCVAVSKTDEFHPERARVKKLSLDIAERYRMQNTVTAASLQSTFHLLLDLIAFFDLYHADQHEQAFDVLSQLQLLPTDTEQVSEFAQAFKMHSDEIRQNVAPLLLASMNLLTKKSTKSSKTERTQLKKTARALIIFAGMLPYHLPADTTSLLVKLEVQLK